MKTLLVEGWRGIPHSYAITNQSLCLALLEDPRLRLFHRDVPLLRPHWEPRRGILTPEAEARARGLPAPSPNLRPDATYRIGFPYDFTPPPAGTLCAFVTAELGFVSDDMVRSGLPIGRAVEDGDALIHTPPQWSKAGLLASGVASDRVRVIPLGVDTEIFRPTEPEHRKALKTKLQLEDRLLFLNIGALSTNKGLVLLLRGLAELAPRLPEARLIVKGLDSLYTSKQCFDEALRGLTAGERRRIEGRVGYLGGLWNQSAMADLYRAADCYVSPYLAEGFNLPVLEAIASGTPVICTAGGSTDDFVDDSFALKVESSERLEPTGDRAPKRFLLPHLDSLVTQMERVASDSRWRESARRAGPQHVQQSYTWKRVARKLLEAIFDEQGLGADPSGSPPSA